MDRRERDRQVAKKASMRDWAKKPSVRGFEATCIKLPNGVEFVKLASVGMLKWDFMYSRAGKFNPRADEGFECGELEYTCHRIPTANGTRNYLCRACINERCAACDWLRENRAIADKKLLDQLRPNTRHLWVVNDKPGDTKNKLKVFDSNHFNKKRGFGEQMAAAINTLDESEEPFAFEGGYTAILTVEEDTFPGGKYNLVSRIDLRKRNYSYPKSMLDAAPCLDDCLVDPGYDAVMQLLETGEEPARQETTDAGDRNVSPPKKQAATITDEDEDEERPPVKTSEKPVVEEEDEIDTDEDDTDEDESPPVKTAKKAAKPSDEDEDENLWEEDEDKDDEPPKKAAKKK